MCFSAPTATPTTRKWPPSPTASLSTCTASRGPCRTSSSELMPIANHVDTAAAVRRRLADGGTILVVGSRSTNFSPELRHPPRLHFWDSTDAKIETRMLPDNARVIICTRFISHAVFARVHRFADKRRLLMVPGL